VTIEKLSNPLTNYYKQLKELINDEEFIWHWVTGSVNFSKEEEGYINKGYYTHSFLKRPEAGNLLFPKEPSEYIHIAHSVVMEILLANNIKPAVFYRISANCDHPHESELPNVRHMDHAFPHENLLVYLSDPEEGYTMVEDEKYFGKEDDAIIFNGIHCNASPKVGRRLVIIATFTRYG